MKIKQLKIAGFRGFNSERVIDFDERLTVISAPNSHGKTSISEALEFLLYGVTSKVEEADSKDEYKNSYRNRHFPDKNPAYIEAVMVDDKSDEKVFRMELDSDGTTRRFVDGKEVSEWPFLEESAKSARPFVLQHALKYLLLVEPSARFEGFAKLLGLDDVEVVFQAILRLCTKPTASIPPGAQQILADLELIKARLEKTPSLKSVVSQFNKGFDGLAGAYEIIEARGDELIGASAQKDRLKALIETRSAATAKVYSGNIEIQPIPKSDVGRVASAEGNLPIFVDETFVREYGELAIQGISAKLQEEAQLLKLGVNLLKGDSSICPLCKQPVDKHQQEEIEVRHQEVADEIKKYDELEKARQRIKQRLETLKTDLGTYEEINEQRIKGLLASSSPENKEKIASLLGGADAASVGIINIGAESAAIVLKKMQDNKEGADASLNECVDAITSKHENIDQAKNLGEALQKYTTASKEFSSRIAEIEETLVGPAKLLRQAVDALAGTEEVSLVIVLLEKKKEIEKALKIQDILDGLKDLKKIVEQTLAEMMESAMSTDLTAAVMKWYSKIKTTGDPDVHFSGFAMEKTKSGDYKSRRLAVKAESYGVELASAVSSLSESKLNALGLCVSIASALKDPGPWSFLIIDDPIQSWDDEHEVQFIDVIRNLVEAEHKQIVVLSHKNNWAEQVCGGCRAVNGLRYQINKYTKDGPQIIPVDWAPIEQRLREAEALANGVSTTSVGLQQAEEELRLASCQLASMVAKEKLGRSTSPHNMNKNDVRSIFIGVGVQTDLADRVQAMFVNADDSHHAPKTYQPNAERIRQAISSLREIYKLIK